MNVPYNDSRSNIGHKMSDENKEDDGFSDMDGLYKVHDFNLNQSMKKLPTEAKFLAYNPYFRSLKKLPKMKKND